jgi:hypothetical protein
MVPASATHGARAVPDGVATSCHLVVKSFSKLFTWRLPSFNQRRSTRVYHGNVLEERRTTDYQRAGETSRDKGTPDPENPTPTGTGSIYWASVLSSPGCCSWSWPP